MEQALVAAVAVAAVAVAAVAVAAVAVAADSDTSNNPGILVVTIRKG
jgi:hypothetical protein